MSVDHHLLTILIAQNATDTCYQQAPLWIAERLQSDFPSYRIIYATSWSEVDQHLQEVDVFFGGFLDGERVKIASRLRWLHTPSIGVNQLLSPELIASNVILTNSPTVQGSVVAEHALSLMLALARLLHTAIQKQIQHEWSQKQMLDAIAEQTPRTLSGSTVVLVGVGYIGSQLCNHLRALGMHILVVRRRDERGAESGHEVINYRHINRVLPRADFLVLCAPLTDETHHLIDRVAFKLLRRSAYLVNVGRGELVDEEALIEALQQKTIAGAALDVFNREPLPIDSALWSLNNVIITSHYAGYSEQTWMKHYELFRHNIERMFIYEQKPENIVDRGRY